jgi:hypothetical protein
VAGLANGEEVSLGPDGRRSTVYLARRCWLVSTKPTPHGSIVGLDEKHILIEVPKEFAGGVHRLSSHRRYPDMGDRQLIGQIRQVSEATLKETADFFCATLIRSEIATVQPPSMLQADSGEQIIEKAALMAQDALAKSSPGRSHFAHRLKEIVGRHAVTSYILPRDQIERYSSLASRKSSFQNLGRYGG